MEDGDGNKHEFIVNYGVSLTNIHQSHKFETLDSPLNSQQIRI